MSASEEPGGPQTAIRLIFAVEGDEISLISRQPVEMTLPAPHAIEGEVAPHAFAAELRSAEDEVLHRVPLPDPLSPHLEVFSEEAEENIHRVPVERPSGAFTVVVPDREEAEYVALVSGPTVTEAEVEGLDATREVGRFPLREGDEAS